MPDKYSMAPLYWVVGAVFGSIILSVILALILA